MQLSSSHFLQETVILLVSFCSSCMSITDIPIDAQFWEWILFTMARRESSTCKTWIHSLIQLLSMDVTVSRGKSSHCLWWMIAIKCTFHEVELMLFHSRVSPIAQFLGIHCSLGRYNRNELIHLRFLHKDWLLIPFPLCLCAI